MAMYFLFFFGIVFSVRSLTKPGSHCYTNMQVVCDINEWLSFSSSDAGNDASMPRIRLKMKLSTHIPSYDLVLLSH